MRGCVGFAALFATAIAIACGGQASTTTSGLACAGQADCGSGMVCCAETVDLSTAGSLVTACRSTCITDAPRWQVCQSDAECENGHCEPHDCGSHPELRYCQKPDACR